MPPHVKSAANLTSDFTMPALRAQASVLNQRTLPATSWARSQVGGFDLGWRYTHQCEIVQSHAPLRQPPHPRVATANNGCSQR
eukprot:13785266-Alexandrium_andersonii.AAC.1